MIEGQKNPFMHHRPKESYSLIDKEIALIFIFYFSLSRSNFKMLLPTFTENNCLIKGCKKFF